MKKHVIKNGRLIKRIGLNTILPLSVLLFVFKFSTLLFATYFYNRTNRG